MFVCIRHCRQAAIMSFGCSAIATAVEAAAAATAAALSSASRLNFRCGFWHFDCRRLCGAYELWTQFLVSVRLTVRESRVTFFGSALWLCPSIGNCDCHCDCYCDCDCVCHLPICWLVDHGKSRLRGLFICSRLKARQNAWVQIIIKLFFS